MADPDLAQADPPTLQLLSDLSRCLLRVAVISGRDADWLIARLPIPELTIVGNHGFEEADAGQPRAVPEAQPFIAAIERAAHAVARLPEARLPGVAVERKAVTLAVHFRKADDPSAARAALERPLQMIATREGLRLHPGRRVWELRPPLDIGKGTALRRLQISMKPAAVMYIGDDVTDADAFAALRRMAGIQTLAVGVRSAEADPSIFADCDLVLDDISEVNVLLTELRARCEPKPAGEPR